MTAAQAAKKIGVSRQSLYNWLKAGHLVGPAKLSRNRQPRAWTNAHVEAARGARKRIPRPGRKHGAYKVVDVRQIARLRAARTPWRTVARQVGCCIPTARAALRRVSVAPR
jgi:hypothetical protein